MGLVALFGLAGALASPAQARPISKEQMAYALGKNLGLAAVGHDRDAPRGAVTRLFRKADILARALGVSLPPLPARTGVKARDSAALLRYLLRDAGRPLQATLEVRHGRRPAALFELATKACILAMIYLPGDSLSRSAAVGIERAALRAGVPAAIWSPLVGRVRARAPYAQVKEAVFELHRNMDGHLEHRWGCPMGALG
jgi:hypothetical protein